jgi:ABC-2 type transport system permease protein
MDKIWLILSREYVSRVKKKSFLLATFLTPLFIGGLYAVAIYFAVSDSDEKVVKVIDESGVFAGKMESRNNVVFEFVNEPIDSARKNVEKEDFTGLLYIKDIDINDPQGITFYSMTTPGIDLIRGVNKSLEAVVRDMKIERMGFSKSALDSLNTNVEITSISLSGEDEKEANSGIAMAVGSFSGILIYMFMLIYGAQVMRGVMQEKTSKIVEILVSSVRPFHLMMGKILGIAAVGLTQFILWVGLTIIIISIAGPLLGGGNVEDMAVAQSELAQSPAAQNELLATIDEVVNNLNVPLLVGSFFFYFLTGYLFYAALFAMIGAVVDSEADTQQFMLPIMLPLIASMMFLGVIIKDPSGPIAFWMSIIPFFSPIIMMIRIPFDVPLWELILSMLLMVAGFLATTWMAGRVYRIGILMHGAKVNYKVMFKWLMMKN